MTLIRVAPTTMQMYILNMVIILVIMYSNVKTAIAKIHTSYILITFQ